MIYLGILKQATNLTLKAYACKEKATCSTDDYVMALLTAFPLHFPIMEKKYNCGRGGSRLIF